MSPRRAAFPCDRQLAGRLRDVVGVYAADLPDPTAAEVLLVIDEVLDIVGLSTHWREWIYGPRVAAFLETWDAVLGPTRPPARAGLAPWGATVNGWRLPAVARRTEKTDHG